MTTIKRREAGQRAFPEGTQPALLRPPSECSTTDLALNTSREVKEMLRDMKRKRKVVKDTGTPNAA